MGQNAITHWDTIASTTRDVLLILLLVVQSCHAHALRKLGRKREAKAAEAHGQLIQQELDRRNGVGAAINVTALRSDGAMATS